jgi:hypothetical protein
LEKFSSFSLLFSHAIPSSPNHHQACKLLPSWIPRLEKDLLSWFYSSSSLPRTIRSLDVFTTSSPHQEKFMKLGFIYSMVPLLIQEKQYFFYGIMGTRKLEDQS